MLETLYIIIMMMLLFGITIFVHEFGHYIVARWCGLVVETFSIGMGPALWKKEIGGITYKIGAFPIGGYVALPQLDPEGMEKMQGPNENDRATLPEVTPWKKMAVSFAGPLFNILLAIPLALIVASAEKLPEHTVVGTIDTNSVAYAEGLAVGDEILEINGKPAIDWYNIRVEDYMAADRETLTLKVRNTTRVKTISIPRDDKDIALLSAGPAMRPLIAQATKGDPAEDAGIKTGDLIVSVNGVNIKWWHELARETQKYADTDIPVVLKRNNALLTVQVTPTYKEEAGKVIMGVIPGDPGMLPWTMDGNPIEQIGNDASKIVRLLKALTTKGEAKQAASGLGGPIAIFTMIWFALKLGFVYAIGLIRFININLAVLNLLPIPVLDGGHIVFSLWEGITRRKVPAKVVMTLVNLFAILLIAAMLTLSWRDADRNWNISRFFKKAPAEQMEQPASESAITTNDTAETTAK